MIREVHPLTKLPRRHLEALNVNSEVTRWFRQAREPQMLVVTPEDTSAVLHAGEINALLIGTHRINAYRAY